LRLRRLPSAATVGRSIGGSREAVVVHAISAVGWEACLRLAMGVAADALCPICAA
jgi:hypothetical protein